MPEWSDPRLSGSPFAAATGARTEAYDAGLRSYMLSVYNYMASGVLLTGIVALLFSRGGETSMAAQVFLRGGILSWVIILSPLAIIFALSGGLQRFSQTTVQALYWTYAVLTGLSLSVVFLVYSGTSIAQAFFATAAAFAGLSLWGYTTKRDLAPVGTFLIMGLVGLIVAMVINLFMHSTVLELGISAIGVLIFAGLTAYHTQSIKSTYSHVAGTDMEGKLAIYGALRLYLDFINMFLFILRLFGSSRN